MLCSESFNLGEKAILASDRVWVDVPSVTDILGSVGAPSLVLLAAWMWLLHRSRTAGWKVALLSLPGTTAHEFFHYAYGLLLGAKPVSVSLFPKKNGNTWILGSVSFARLNIWNAAFVALAPLTLYPLGYVLLVYVMEPALKAGDLSLWFFSGYLAACCFFSGFPSSTDFKVGATSIVLYGAVGFGLWQLAH